MSRLSGLCVVAALALAACNGGDTEHEDTFPAAPAPRLDEAAAPAPRPEEAPIAEFSEEEGARVLPVLRDGLATPELAPAVRVWVVRQIGAIPGDEATRLLAEALGSDEPEVARAAVDALADRPGPAAREALESASAHSDPSVSRRAQEILAGG